MSYPTKIATCCYCANRTVLQLDKGRHALSCASCAAPLRNLKLLPQPVDKQQAVSHRPAVRTFSKQPKPKPLKKKKRSKNKKRKSWLRDWAEDAFEFVEDIFD